MNTSPDTAVAVRALTIYQPWADAIVHLRKDVENRSWVTPYTGLLLIHSAQRADQTALKEAPKDLPGIRGAVIAVARLTGCHLCDATCSPWAQPGSWHWTFTDVTALASPLSCPGARKLWIPSTTLRARVADSLAPEAAGLRQQLLAYPATGPEARS
ncbi:hypothetical protein ACIOUE_37770 [Streptomyces xanthochromogenes]|uniref:hypothetical protein n=1 Tax=Streptomyces xanthochromogenes TaxID=67384 RepID=UPI0037FAF163